MDQNPAPVVATATEIQRLKNENKELKTEVKRLKEIITDLCSKYEPLDGGAALINEPSEEATLMTLDSEFDSLDLTESLEMDDTDEVAANSTRISKPNPLLMEDILGVLVKILNFQSLQNARLVCTTWKEASTRRFLSKAMMIVQLDLFEFPMKDFEAVFPTSTEDSKRFKALKLTWPDYLQHLIRRDWLSHYGKSIQYIQLGDLRPEIKDWEWVGLMPAAMDIETILINSCPNLKTLVIPVPFLNYDLNINVPLIYDIFSTRVVHLDLLHIGLDETLGGIVEDGDPTFCKLLELVFGCIASLKTLKLVSCLRCLALSQLIEAIEGKTEMNILEGLDKLNIVNFYTHPNVLEKLSKIKFRKLTKLKFGRFSDFTKDHSISFFKFLNHVKANLEELVLGMRGDEDPTLFIPTPIPHLPELKVFRNISLREWFIDSIDFMLRLPKLQELMLFINHLDDCTLEDMFPPTIQLQDMPHLNLKELFTNCKVNDPQVFEFIAKCFPNLEILRVRFDGINLMGCLSPLTSLKKLKLLDVDLHSSIQPNDFCKALISTIPEFPALTKLVLRNETAIQCLPEEIFTNGLFRASFLRSLELWSLDLTVDAWRLVLDSPDGSKLNVALKVRFPEIPESRRSIDDVHVNAI